MAEKLTLDAILTVLTQYAGRYSCLHLLACHVDDLLAGAHPRVEVTVWSVSGVVRCRLVERGDELTKRRDSHPAARSIRVFQEATQVSARVTRPTDLTLGLLRREEGNRRMIVAHEADGWRPYRGAYHAWAAVALN